tara:strand:- start:787 stop:1005 length:219 start_codon:yes stop_codon:yes gene_type:complete
MGLVEEKMSYDVSLTIKDYANIVSWFERVFGKNNDVGLEDRATFTKLSAMAMALAEDEKKELDITDDDESEE